MLCSSDHTLPYVFNDVVMSSFHMTMENTKSIQYHTREKKQTHNLSYSTKYLHKGLYAGKYSRADL